MATSPKINRNTSHDLAAIGVRLLDEAHMTWVAAEVESEQALHAWLEGTTPNRAAAYAAYRAAIDSEEAAARDLQRLYVLTLPCQEQLVQR
jgi:hypothetical protein